MSPKLEAYYENGKRKLRRIVSNDFPKPYHHQSWGGAADSQFWFYRTIDGEVGSTVDKHTVLLKRFEKLNEIDDDSQEWSQNSSEFERLVNMQ